MKQPEIPSNEIERLKKLIQYNVLDTQPESDFNEIVRVASLICEVPISLVSLIDENRQWFKAKVGLDANETSREISFCGHAILTDELFEVENALNDERFQDNPLVTGDPNIRFYAGMPLVSSEGYNIGTLCVIDRVPKTLNDTQKEVLRVLAKNVITLMELRLKNSELETTSNQFIAIAEKAQVNEQIAVKALSVLAHDMREPLATLDGILNLFSDSKSLSPELFGVFLNNVKLQLKNTQKLMDELVHWGKNALINEFESQQVENINLHDQVNEIFRLKELKANDENISLINTVPQDLLLKSNLFQIDFALRNLIDNALKYTNTGSITCGAVAKDGSIEIFIQDTGVGMSQEIIDKLLNADSYYTTVGNHGEKGSGLGLKLIRSNILKLGGTLKIESEIGKGSTITLNIPCKD